MNSELLLPNRARKKLGVTGVVQGVGFRPFVYRLARQHHLTGFVRNTSGGVEIEVEGPPAALEVFLRQLSEAAPALARVETVVAQETQPRGETQFIILTSQPGAQVEAVIPADVGLCEDCAREILDPRDRRYLYPFTNCTNCGPRFTLVRAVPYDRQHTTMAVFPMCPACRQEYHDPEDRRFHAEPTACPVCGPHIWLEEGTRRLEKEVLEEAGKLLWVGKIVAVKGLGGFHLACDARQEAAVETLRQRKGRQDKPFAVMVRDLKEAEGLCRLTEAHRRLLLSPERPAVLCPRRADSGIALAVAPGNNYLGLLLPYTPLHLLLLRHTPAALVMTSGNLSEEPLVFDNDAARQKLGRLAAAFLMHNRDIEVPCDDSVVRPVGEGEVMPIRRARGYVPATLTLPLQTPEVILGVGAEQKNTFCLAWDNRAMLSQHIGDLETVETFDYFQLAIRHFGALSRKTADLVAHDLHPGYLSTRYALELAGVTRVGVQHHHAHIAACLVDNGRSERCIGLALDGTGYGPDGSVWGGEILVASLKGYERAGHLALVRLPGGEAAVKDPCRMAAAYLHAAYGNDFLRMAAALDLRFTSLEENLLRRQLAEGWRSPLTSSAGRLFDAVAAALGICRRRTYEGQPAVELEMLASETETGYYPGEVTTAGNLFILNTVGLFRAGVEAGLAGGDLAVIAARFHHSLAQLLAQTCLRLREQTGLNLVALSGGVFQNARLLGNLQQRLISLGFEVLSHRHTPPNDGCISLGQVAVAAARLQ